MELLHDVLQQGVCQNVCRINNLAATPCIVVIVVIMFLHVVIVMLSVLQASRYDHNGGFRTTCPTVVLISMSNRRD